MKIKFNQDYSTKARPEDQEHYAKGSVHEMNDHKAQHYLNRGVADEVESRKAFTEKATPPPPSKGKSEDEGKDKK